LKAACLFLCFKWLDGQTRSCWLVFVLCGLGFLDKFNFLWFIIALVAATGLVYGNTILFRLRKLRPVGLVGLGLGLLGGGLLALWIIFPLLQRPHGSVLWGRLAGIWRLYEYTCTGQATAVMWFKSPLQLPVWTGWVLPLLTLVFLVLVFASRATKDEVRVDGRVLRFCLWCLLMFGVVFLEVALTPQAGGVHHTIMLFPFDLLACFSAAYLLANALPRRQRWPLLVLQSALLGLWVVSNLTSAAMHFRQFKNTDDFHGRFSPRIEALAKYLDKKGRTADAIYCVEWGLGNQLRALCQPSIAAKVKDFWPAFQDWTPNGADAQSTRAALFPDEEKALYVAFAKEDPVYPPAQNHFAEMAALSAKVTRPLSKLPADLARTYQVFQSAPR